ncbi:plant self-incompatibility protein S1 family [Artemisia annua]|uniref:S-protein homolog n=1 Tax=Artemisia annua TaxID=35608 RepID=A0A2U1NCI6_ARTAN|nr:plant self-incompatibility protein S1 family [Artemisia annua]
MKRLFFIVFILLVLSCFNSSNACSIFVTEFTVYIKSTIVGEDVTLRCQSKDDDFGYHVLNSSKVDYDWSFCQNFWGSTLYFCHFWRPNYEQVFDVFNNTIVKHCIQGTFDDNICSYEVRDDGFYLFKQDNYVWVKWFDWKQASSTELPKEYTLSP